MKHPLVKLTALLLCLMLVFAGCAPAAPAPAPAPAPEVTEADYEAWAKENGYVKADEIPAPAPAEEPEEEVWDKEVDLLVMGCGPAGVSAAVEAVDNGCESVMIIEKTAMIGGTSLMSEGILSGYETQLSKKFDVHVTAQECYDRMMMLSDYRNDPELTWVTAEKCGETIDWLIDVLKVPFVDEVIVNPSYGPLQMVHNVEGKGAGFLEPFQNALDSRGIEVMLETPGYKLLAGENGQIIGALAKNADGEDVRIKCKAVVLATGGFGNNTDLVGSLMPLYKGGLPCAHVGATGDGLMMASELGAAVVNVDLFRGSLGDYDIIHDYGVGGFEATIAYFMLGGGPIVVDKDGNRFTDEKQRKMNAFFTQMRKDGADYLWAINDQKGIDEAQPQRALGTSYTSAETLDELAEIMGVPAENLKATVARWNELCAAGADTDFGRTAQLKPLDTPPYYCVKTAPGSMGNYGGLLRNIKSEVLKVSGEPIPGLYVAGGTAAVACENGWTMSHAFTYGRLAGRNSVEYMATVE